MLLPLPLLLATSYSDAQLRSLRNGFGTLAFVGAVFLALALVVFCIAIARRLARRRARLNDTRQPEPATEPLDIWSESARRVTAEPADDDDDADAESPQTGPEDEDDPPTGWTPEDELDEEEDEDDDAPPWR